MLPSPETPPEVPVERSRSPSPQTEIKQEDPIIKPEEEPIVSPSRKGDATGDSGTGGTSIPSTPDSVFLERTLDRSDIESTSGYVIFIL